MTEAKRVPSLGKDDRNFRSHYYEKVGFRGVDERKTLELLWNEDPLSIDKFCNFAQRCTIPSCDRIQVWKVILGVSPRFANNKERNWKWKVQPYEDNMRFMTSAGKIDEARPKAQNHTILWLVFNGRLNFDFKPQLSEFWPMNFSAISESMLSICDDHDASVIESFYLAKGLTDVLHKFPDDVINETIQCYHRMLANNSNTNKLYGHLEKIGLNEEIPLKSWICRGFAGVLNTSALEKIWDKVIGGSLKILVFVALALIESSKMALQGCQTSQEAIRCLVSTSEDADEVIAQKAIEMWMDDGSQIYAGDKTSNNATGASKSDNKVKPQTQILSSVIEPNFPMVKMIKIGYIEDLEPIDE